MRCRPGHHDLPLGGRSCPAHGFASLPGAVRPLLGPNCPAKLEKSRQHGDISFLAGETGTQTRSVLTRS